MNLQEALDFADEWTKGHTFYEGLQGWRVVCATLATEVRRLQAERDISKMLVEIAELSRDELMEPSESITKHANRQPEETK